MVQKLGVLAVALILSTGIVKADIEPEFLEGKRITIEYENKEVDATNWTMQKNDDLIRLWNSSFTCPKELVTSHDVCVAYADFPKSSNNGEITIQAFNGSMVMKDAVYYVGGNNPIVPPFVTYFIILCIAFFSGAAIYELVRTPSK